MLSFLSFGLYYLYWITCINNDVAEVCDERRHVGGLMVILLSIITFRIYFIYWCYQQGKKIDNIKREQGYDGGNLAIICLVCSFLWFGIISLMLIQNELNKFELEV